MAKIGTYNGSIFYYKNVFLTRFVTNFIKYLENFFQNLNIYPLFSFL